ncbi:hypothetical protein DFJ74DRAFT_705084 [Hyaloraphidium curvatum]|nr:hypothetical protein DFJ74DRAFT_705084 [Hyaloraphidium curvatum]
MSLEERRRLIEKLEAREKSMCCMGLIRLPTTVWGNLAVAAALFVGFILVVLAFQEAMDIQRANMDEAKLAKARENIQHLGNATVNASELAARFHSDST